MTKPSRQPLRHRPRRNQPGWCPACRKLRFPTEKAALAAIAAMIADGRAAEHPRAGEPLEAYKCHRGPGYHFGHAGCKRRRA